IKEDGKVKFTDKPCGKLKGVLIHQETKEEATANALKNKTANIGRLIRLGRDQAARNYAKKYQLEDAYKEEVAAYNQHLEQQIKKQELAAKKQDKAIKQQQLLMQQQSLILQQQQLAQDQQQAEAEAQKKTTRRYYPYYYPYTLPSSTHNKCKKYGVVTNCQQSVYGTKTPSTYTPEWQKKKALPEWQKKTVPAWRQQQLLRNQYNYGTTVNGSVSVQVKDKDSKSGVYIQGNF
ncbi:MAG: hypothetical protein GQ569_06345, partial [Methylococcaceae bacterium]|nr:hypothetical protein [Methylococcaceae bacterium]